MNSLEQFREEQLAASRRLIDEALAAFRAKLRQERLSYFDECVATVQADLQKKSANAVREFNQEMVKIEEMKRAGKNPTRTLEFAERSLKQTLQSTLDFHQRLVKNFIAGY